MDKIVKNTPLPQRT